MPDLVRARAFVEAHGDEVDLARLRWLLDATPPDPALLERALATQRPDGGWPSADGPDREVHTTLEAIRALRWVHSSQSHDPI